MHEKPWMMSPMGAPSVRAVATTYASTRARDSSDSWPLLGGVRALAVWRTIVPLYTAVRVTCTRPFCACVLLCSFLVCEGQAKEGSDLEASAALALWSSELESCHYHARVWQESVELDCNCWNKSFSKFCFLRARVRACVGKKKKRATP